MCAGQAVISVAERERERETERERESGGYYVEGGGRGCLVSTEPFFFGKR